MQRGWRPWVGCLALTAAVTVFLLFGRLAAQVPGQQVPGQSGGILSPAATPPDELAPQLLSGPNGEVFRFWRSWSDIRTGGGGTFLSVASPQHAWTKVLELVPSEPGVTALDPDVAFGSSNQVALAYQWRRHFPRTKQIRLALSHDGGKTWTQPSTPVNTSGQGFTPKLGWGRGQSLIVAWADEWRAQGAWDIYARRSPDGGSTWEPPQILSRFPQQMRTDIYYRPEMITDGQDHFWVVWVGLRNGRSSLYLSRSTDGGRTWADPAPLSGESVSVFGQRLVRSGDRLLIVWQDTRTGKERVYAVASSDRGVTWSPPVRVDHLPVDSQTSASAPAAVMGPDGEVFVVWQDGRNGRDDIFIGRSPDGGLTWGAEDARLDMDEPGTAVSRFAAIARSEDGRLAVAWEDDRAGHEGIHLRVRAAGNSPWGPEVLVAPPGQKKGAKTVSLLWGKAGALYVAWEAWDYSRGPDLAVRQIGGRTLLLDKK